MCPPCPNFRLCGDPPAWALYHVSDAPITSSCSCCPIEEPQVLDSGVLCYDVAMLSNKRGAASGHRSGYDMRSGTAYCACYCGHSSRVLDTGLAESTKLVFDCTVCPCRFWCLERDPEGNSTATGLCSLDESSELVAIADQCCSSSFFCHRSWCAGACCASDGTGYDAAHSL
jgi:hypothetical protein